MREIKFRAWHKRTQLMAEVVLIDFYSEEIGILYADPVVQKFNLNEVELMQYTGLKDKNGQEIYDGDIVIAWSQGVKGTFEIKRRIDGLWLLYPAWKDGQFWYLSPNEDGRETIEIIGNIFENKELLNG